MDIDKLHESRMVRILDSTLKLNPMYLQANPESLLGLLPKEMFLLINSYFISKFNSLTACWEIQNLMLAEPLPRQQSEVENHQQRLDKIADTFVEQIQAIPVNTDQPFNLYDGNTNFTLFQLGNISKNQDKPEIDEVAQNKPNR